MISSVRTHSDGRAAAAASDAAVQRCPGTQCEQGMRLTNVTNFTISQSRATNSALQK